MLLFLFYENICDVTSVENNLMYARIWGFVSKINGCMGKMNFLILLVRPTVR